MSKVNYAAIDIGSNAVRLLIKSINPETSEQLFTKELLLRVPLRLGEEVFTHKVKYRPVKLKNYSV